MPDKPIAAISRRHFTRRAAIAAAVASMAPAATISGELGSGAEQTPPSANTTAHSFAQPQLPRDVAKLSPESQAEADARFQSILAQYGDRFSEEQKADLRRLCIVAQPPLDRLRAYQVENGDGPGLYLKPLFEREKKPKAAQPAQPVARTTGATTKP
jgi:hypothetical protein